MSRVLKLAPLAAVLVVIGLTSYTFTSHAGAALIGVASAATVEAPTLTVASEPGGLSWAEWLVVGAAAVGGLLKILDVVIAGLKWLAPRTEATIDDTLLALAQSAHERLDELEGILAKATGNATQPGRPGNSQAGFVRVGTMVAIVLLGVLVACATVKTEIKTTFDGIVTCAKADKPKVQALAVELGTKALMQIAFTGHVDPAALKATAIAAGKTQGLEIAACSFRGLVADLDALFKAQPQPEGFLPIADPSDEVHEALAAFQAEFAIRRIDL